MSFTDDKKWKAFVIHTESKKMGIEPLPPMESFLLLNEEELDKLMDDLKEIYVKKKMSEMMQVFLDDVDKHGLEYAHNKHVVQKQ